MPEPLMRLTDVVKIYDTGEVPFTALRGINLDVDAGEFVGLIGKSGSGKTTLINMITGIDRPTSGEVVVDGTPGARSSTRTSSRMWRGKTIGVVFQFFQLLPTLTVVENVMLPMDFCRMYTPEERPERAMDLLEQVEMADQAHKLPAALSGGQQQRVAIARALANDPPIIAADEPTGNLDSKTADAVFGLFERLVDAGQDDRHGHARQRPRRARAPRAARRRRRDRRGAHPAARRASSPRRPRSRGAAAAGLGRPPELALEARAALAKVSAT